MILGVYVIDMKIERPSHIRGPVRKAPPNPRPGKIELGSLDRGSRAVHHGAHLSRTDPFCFFFPFLPALPVCH